jgi:hypothetical protein
MPVVCGVKVVLKKGKKKPYTLNSFSFKPLLVCTARSHLNVMWYQEKFDTTKESIGVLKILADDGGAPDAYLLSFEDVKEFFWTRYQAKAVGAEFIGRDGKPKFAWPMLADFDNNHSYVIGIRTPRARARGDA